MSPSLAEDVLKERNKKQRKFIHEMRDFPCSFNLGNCNLTVGEHKYSGKSIDKPNLQLNKWKYLTEDLKDSKDAEYEETVWKDNLLTHSLFKIGALEEATKLNKKTQERCCGENLVALANSAFLHFYNNDLAGANDILRKLKELRLCDKFQGMKLHAITEQGYAFRKFGGAKNLLSTISLLTFALPLLPEDERLEFMLAMVYRRCTNINVYSEDPANINQHDFALEAATSLFRLSTTAKNRTIKSASCIELAYLQNSDDKALSCRDTSGLLLNTAEWNNIVGKRTWRHFCEDAIGYDDSSEKVLKIAGELFRSSENDNDLRKSEKYLKSAIEIKPTNRAHHHLALTYQEMAINFEKQRCNNAVQIIPNQSDCEINSDLKELPQTPLQCVPQNLSKLYKFNTTVPENVHKFSKDNPYIKEAIFHFEKAVELSHKQNRPAIYDLAKMFLQTGNFTDAKVACCNLIQESICSEDITDHPIFLVKAYHLNGVCCALEAEEVFGERRQELQAESEHMLVMSIRLGTRLTKDVPELATCTTDLWNAFTNLRKKFKFGGQQEETKEKLFMLCESAADYRLLQVMDDIFLQDPSVWESKDALEQCLKCHLNKEAIDSALLFWDMIKLFPWTKHKLKWWESEAVQHLMLAVIKRTLDRAHSERQTCASWPDPIWKQLLYEELQATKHLKIQGKMHVNDTCSNCQPEGFQVTEDSEMNDIVIVNDVGNDCEPDDSDPVSDNVCKSLKQVLKNVCGLKTVRAHEEVIFGRHVLEGQLSIISNSRVAIFVLINPLHSLKSDFEKSFRISETESRSLKNSDNLSETGDEDICKTGGVITNNKKGDTQPVSRALELIIDTSVSNYVHKSGPARIISVVGNQFKYEDIPQVLRGQPVIFLSDSDVQAMQCNCSDQPSQLIMEIFRALVNKPEQKDNTHQLVPDYIQFKTTNFQTAVANAVKPELGITV